MPADNSPKSPGLNRQSLSQRIVQEVLGWLADGRYKPDDALPTEKDLMAHFNVGRNSVREATQAMVTMGVIDVRPGRGSRVLRTSPADVLPPEVISALMLPNTLEELYEFRLLIEPGIAASAAERATPEDIASMKAALDRYEEAMDAGEPVAPHDVLFHRCVAAAAHNSIYLKITDAVSSLLISARRATDLVHAAVHAAADDHRAIVEAIEQKDSDLARERMSDHVRSAAEALAQAREITQMPASSGSVNDPMEELDE
jgi:DNA-binding FadR family transcriptional regulator